MNKPIAAMVRDVRRSEYSGAGVLRVGICRVESGGDAGLREDVRVS